MSAQSRAFERSEPGVGAPILMANETTYAPYTKGMNEGWRRNTPPIVESLDETYEHVIEKQGREDNRGPS